MPRPFFAEEQSAKQRKIPVKARARSSKARKLDCESCGLFKNCKSPKMVAHGNGRLRILVHGEGPGANEDDQDCQFVGEAGQLLERYMREAGIDLWEDCWTLNAVNCWTGEGNPEPSKHQVDCCRTFRVNPTIEELKPKFIVLLGNKAMQSFWGERHADLKINTYRGRIFPDKRTGAWVMPMFHPSFLGRREEFDEDLKSVFRRDMRNLSLLLKRPAPEFIDPLKYFDSVTDFDDLVIRLKAILEWATELYFDYETTGLKAIMAGHRVAAINVSFRIGEENTGDPVDNDWRSFSFPYKYPGAWTPQQLKVIGDLWGQILGCERILKAAHNIPMEDRWSCAEFGVQPTSWDWCTMTNEHLIDNQSGITGLKFIAWQQYGIEGYDELFARFREGVLTEEDKQLERKVSSHHFNRIMEMPLKDLLEYGGQDAVFGAWRWDDQRKVIRPGTAMWQAKKLFHDALMVICDFNQEGVPIDEKYYDVEKVELQKWIDAAHTRLMLSREAKLFHQKEGRPLNLASNPDLQKLFYTHMGKTIENKTATGKGKVDQESLAGIGGKFVTDFLAIKKKDKIAHTYFDQIRRESINGRCYPNTNLNIARTFRPSMDTPNLANTPKRDKEAKLAVRKGITAPNGFKLMEVDFGGIEVCGLCWYSKDKKLLDYLHDPTTDMHRDQAFKLFEISPRMWDSLDENKKGVRHLSKNRWVFPQFYGDWYKACATHIWKEAGNVLLGDGTDTKVRDWILETIGSYQRFEEHLRVYEDEFWKVFRGVRQWQDSLSEEYQVNGFIETYLGFRYGGYMTKNKLYNYKVQGTAFHLLLWCMIQLHRLSIQEGWQSKILWQIYDSLIWAVHPAEQEMVRAACTRIMTIEAPKRFKWINTPLKAEFEITGVDGRFADLGAFEEKDNYDTDEDEDAA